MGNYASVIRDINVNAGSDIETVKLVPHDTSLDRILHGSVYYMDLVASAIENVKTVSVTIDLDSLSTWELDHMVVTEGFNTSYTIQEDENIATITITRSGDVIANDEGILVSIPVRVWQLETGYVYANGTKAGSQAFTAKQFRDMKEFWRISLIATVDSGVLTTIDGISSTFTGNRIFVDTEMWAEDADMIATADGLAYYNSWNGGHVHAGKAIDDKASTCTEKGYTDRSYCEGCASVVDWGTIIPATGHTYEYVDGVLKCACGKLFTGTWIDDKEYIDGVLIGVEGGWNGDYYYVNGVKLTGIHKVTAQDGSGEFYYNFGDNGVSIGKYTGLFFDEEDKVYRYAQFGELSSGWKMIDEEWYYFKSSTLAAQTGTRVMGEVTYEFEDNGKLKSGVWHNDGIGTKYYYGYYYYKADAIWKNVFWVDIEGKTYGFNTDGYRYEGLAAVHESNKPLTVYRFSEDGVLIEKVDNYTGFIKNFDNTAYLENGEQMHGLKYIDGHYYYFNTSGYAVTDCTYYCTYNMTSSIPIGNYTFDSEGKMIDAPVLKNGIVSEDGVLYYYVNDVRTQTGLIKIGEDYYYVRTGGVVAADCTYYCTYNMTSSIPIGNYTFDSEGKMINN